MWLWDSSFLNGYYNKNGDKVLIRKNSIFDIINLENCCDLFIKKYQNYTQEDSISIGIGRKISLYEDIEAYNPHKRQKYTKEIKKDYYEMKLLKNKKFIVIYTNYN